MRARGRLGGCGQTCRTRAHVEEIVWGGILTRSRRGCSRAGSRSAKVCEDHAHALDRWGKARVRVCVRVAVCVRGTAGEEEDLGKSGGRRGCVQDSVRVRRREQGCVEFTETENKV